MWLSLQIRGWGASSEGDSSLLGSTELQWEVVKVTPEALLLRKKKKNSPPVHPLVSLHGLKESPPPSEDHQCGEIWGNVLEVMARASCVK